MPRLRPMIGLLALSTCLVAVGSSCSRAPAGQTTGATRSTSSRAAEGPTPTFTRDVAPVLFADPAGARRHLERALALQPNHPTARANLELLNKRGQ